MGVREIVDRLDREGCALVVFGLEAGFEAESAADLLGPSDVRRALAMRAATRRSSFALTRAVLRVLLASVIDADPRALEIVADDRGKPRLGGEANLHFNVAHSKTHGIVGLCKSPIGVDVEDIRPYDAAVVRRVLGDEEIASLVGLDEFGARAAFFRMWTIKEACLKAEGAGLGGLPRGISVPPGEAGSSRGCAWRVYEPSPGVIAAAAVRDPTPPVPECLTRLDPNALMAAARARS